MKLFWNTNNEISSFWGDYHLKNSKKWIYEILENVEFEEVEKLTNDILDQKIIIVDSEIPKKQNFYSNLFRNYDEIYLFHLGDEGGKEYSESFYENFKHIFRPFHLNKFSKNSKITSIPIGYKTGFDKKVIDVNNRKYVWSFMGTIHGSSRFDLVHQFQNIKPNFINITKKFNGEKSLSSKEYYDVLKNCIFSLVPHGYIHPETYRLYESLECGSIPIIENPYNFFNNIYPNNPFYSISVWSEGNKIIKELINNKKKLNEISNKNLHWWTEYKNKLKKNIAKKINV